MLPDPNRREIHHRQIELRFYARDDGLYEVEGRLLDRKTHPFRRVLHEHDTPAGEPLHDITVGLIIDQDMLIHGATASMAVTPFAVCRGAATTVLPLQGLRIGRGWNKQVRTLLGGTASCTHVVELLGPMATTAYQGLAPLRLARITSASGSGSDDVTGKIDSCYAYSAEREVVATLWPHLARRMKQI
jgi:hypothetical protein